MNRYTIEQQELTTRHNGHTKKQVFIWDDYNEATIDLEDYGRNEFFEDGWDLLGFIAKIIIKAQKDGGLEIENSDDLIDIECLLRSMKGCRRVLKACTR